MRITLPKIKTIIKWKAVALSASILCSIAELSNIQTAEQSGYIAEASKQQIEIAKLALSISTDARLLASKTIKDKGKEDFEDIYRENICKVQGLLEQNIRLESSSSQDLLFASCPIIHNKPILEIVDIESQLASKIDEWENDTKTISLKQTQHTSIALKLNYLATILLLAFLGLDLFETYGQSNS